MKVMPENDRVRLRHMLDAARKAQQFMKDKSRQDLSQDDLLAFAVVRALEIIGEAASKVTHETRERYAQVAWQDIVGMRNRVIHAYFDIDLDIVWKTTTDDLPEIIGFLKEILDQEDETNGSD